jgi:hypothetical protein
MLLLDYMPKDKQILHKSDRQKSDGQTGATIVSCSEWAQGGGEAAA